MYETQQYFLVSRRTSTYENNYRPEKVEGRECNKITAKLVPKNYLLKCYICIENNSINQIGRSQRHVPKGLKECLNINCYIISWTTGSLLQLLLLWRPQKTKKRTLMTLNQQIKKISQWTTPLISCAVQYRRSNKQSHART